MDLSYPQNSLARDAYHLTGEDSVGSRFEHPKSSGTLAVSEGAPPGPRVSRPVPQECLSRLRDSRPVSPAPVPAAPPVTCLPQPLGDAKELVMLAQDLTSKVNTRLGPTGCRTPTLRSEALEQGGPCSLGTRGKRRLVSLCGGRGTAAGWVLH